MSGPTIVPEPDVDAQRKAWEDEQVPYDDATIAAYTDDEEIPPFDVPATSEVTGSAPVSSPQPAASAVAATVPPAMSVNPADGGSVGPAPAVPSRSLRPQAPDSTPHAGMAPSAHSADGSAAKPAAPAPPQPDATAAAPWETANPFGHPAEAPHTPETEEEAKAMLGDIFGTGIVFKDA